MPAPSIVSARTASLTKSSRRSTARRPLLRTPSDGAFRGEHRDRRRFDGRLPAGARALSELADRAALRALRGAELPRLRRAGAGRFLRAAAWVTGCARSEERRVGIDSR